MNRLRPSVVLRWIVAGLIGGGGVFLLARMFHGADSVPLIGRSLLGITAIVTGFLLVAPELVRWAVSPLSGLLDSILLPSEEVVPPADLRLARFYSQTSRYDEACEEYERILHYHPDNADAHLEGIRAAALAGNERLARKFFRDARRVMRSRKARDLLDAVYAARNAPLLDAGEAEQPDAALPETSDAPEPGPE